MTEQPEQTQEGGEVPNPQTGVGIGAGAEPSTFEPEEDPEALEDPDASGADRSAGGPV